MLIVQLKGGLGNQLFQYAAGLSLADHLNTTIKVDISELNKADKQIKTFRTFDLQSILLNPEVATAEELKPFEKSILFRVLRKLNISYIRNIYREPSFRFDPNFFERKDGIYLEGYRQSEKYFLPIEQKIRNGFQLKPEVIKNVQDLAAKLRSENSVSVHIRRGDYNNPIVRSYHGVLDENYFQHAINILESKISNATFYVFSDDPSWVTEHLNFSSPFELVSGTYSKTHFEDLYLISQCRNNIIANSTFSWWAAWLNPNKEKLVIAPKKWFNQAPHDTSDLIPDSWIKI